MQKSSLLGIAGGCFLGLMLSLQAFALSSSFVASEIVANAEEILETKASLYLEVITYPGSGEFITIGSCMIQFVNIVGGTVDEGDCSDNHASIDLNGTSRGKSGVAGALRSLINLQDNDHGLLVASSGGTSVVWTTSGTEIYNSEISFSDDNSGEISKVVSIPGVVAQAAVAQVVTFTPIVEGYGETFTITINTSDSSYTSQQGDDLEDVLSGLQIQLLGQSETLCSHDGAKITCIAVVPGTGFSYLASVTDITAPEVILSGGDMIIEIGSNFVDPGAIWMDNVDGSGFMLASDGVVVTETLGWYVLEYRYTDVAGNTSIAVKRVVTVDDLTAPEVSLSGDAVMHIYQGSVYTEPGATWIDNVDGSGMITIASSGMVDIGGVGTYLLEYGYTDAAGNMGNIVTRTVIVDPFPIAGVCGTSYGVCNAGTVVSGADNSCGADDSWTCNGLHGGEHVSCSAPNPVCVTYSWQIGNWGTCSVACGGGIQSRAVVCQGSDEEIVADSFCMSEEKPTLSQSCNTETCPVHGQCGTSYGVCNAGTVVSGADNSCGADDSWTCNGLHGGETIICSASNAACPATGNSTVPSSSGGGSHQGGGSLFHGTGNTATKTSPNVSGSGGANERIYITPRNVYIQLGRFLKNPTILAQTNAPDGTVLSVYRGLLNKKRKKVGTVVVKDGMVLFKVPRPGRYGLSIER